MRVSRALSVVALAAFALAQDFIIQLPLDAQTGVAIGQTIDVQIQQSISGTEPFENVAIVFGIQHCGNTPCSSDDNNDVLGQIVKTSLFNPQLNVSEPFSPPTQAFSILFTGETGFATLHASAMILTGPGPLPLIFSQNASITLVPS